MTNQIQHISVCICTYKRQHFLKRLLEELGRQETHGKYSFSIVVADNDRLESAKLLVLDFSRNFSVPIKYCVEPEQNIALARNRAVENATGDFIAFIDDDESPVSNWLLTLFECLSEHQVDGVLGPVKPFFEQEPPKWLVRGKFCERPEHPTGTEIGWREARTGNVLLKRHILDTDREPFRRQFGSGSEDTDFFRRMNSNGCVFIWCNEAPVHEFVPPARWSRRYLLKRALMRGQNQRHVAGFVSVLKSIVAVPIYTISLPFLLLFGHDLFMKCLIKLCDHSGKILAFLGCRPLGEKYING